MIETPPHIKAGMSRKEWIKSQVMKAFKEDGDITKRLKELGFNENEINQVHNAMIKVLTKKFSISP